MWHAPVWVFHEADCVVAARTLRTLMTAIRQWAKALACTPLHPQWLLGRRRFPRGLAHAAGMLLDIGAADRWIEGLLPDSVEYIALDYPATGRDLYGARPHVFADAARLPFRDSSFDGVVCLEVLEHVMDPAKVLTEISRVLKPGARAWVSMPFLYPLHDAPFDFQRYTEYGLRRDMQRAGLDVASLRKTGHAIRAAGLLLCLAIAGGAYARQGWSRWALLPVASIGVLMVNVMAWLASLVWPDWSHMGMGYELEVSKS